MTSTDLSGLRILVTRPREQAAALLRTIESAGGQVLLFPTLEIQPIGDTRKLANRIAAAAEYQWIIFVSANAVHHGLPVLQQAGVEFAQKHVAAVGQATARALRVHGINVTDVPARRFNSEALAAMPALQRIAGQHVLIVRGAGGREWLRDTLVARGAAVDYAECYQRRCPQSDPRPVLDACRDRKLDLVISTSSEGLQNLVALVDGSTCVLRLPLLLVGERQAQAARRLPWQGKIIVAGDPHDATLIDTMIAQRGHW